MEFANCLGDLLAVPQPSVPSQSLMNDRLVDRQLDVLGDPVRSIKTVVDKSDLMDAHMLINYMDKIKGLKEELQALRREILSLISYRGPVERPLVLINLI